MPNDLTELVSVRYMVADVDAAVDFYTTHLGFTVRMSAAPAFADVTRGRLRLLLSGPASSAGRPMPDGTVPVAGRMEPHSPHRGRYRGRSGAVARRRRHVPERHCQGPRRTADPVGGPVRERCRVIPTRRRIAAVSHASGRRRDFSSPRSPSWAPVPVEWGAQLRLGPADGRPEEISRSGDIFATASGPP